MTSVDGDSSKDEIRVWLVDRVAHYLDRPATKIDPATELAEYGMDSVYSMSIIAEVEDTLQITIDEMAVWKYGTINALVEYVMRLIGSSTPVA